MFKSIKTIPIFFSCFLIFLILTGITLLQIEHGDAVRYFSNHRSVWTDYLFVYGTRLGEIVVYGIIVILLSFIRFRYAFLVGLAGFLTMIISFILKWLFSLDRPFRYFTKLGEIDNINLVDGVTMLKGATSFPSGHTMSAFALYGLIALLFPKKRMLEVTLFFIALLVAFSRIYLVQHFLRDIYLGSILGVLLALFLFWAQSRFPVNQNHWIDRSFSFIKKKP